MPPLNAFKLERYFAQYEFSVQYLLCSSDCESVAIRDLLALEPEAQAQFQDHWLGYTESLGAPGLRQAISQVYTTIHPDQMVVFSGAEEAIFWFMHAVLQPGDHLIVHFPCYQSLTEVARSIGCELTLWEARPENGWGLDIAELKRSLRSNTRAVVLNTPHNPTGYLMPPDLFREVNQLTRERGIVLFSDEVYRESEYDPAHRLPAACDLNPQAVSLGVMSKTYGLPGLRIGWAASHQADLLARMAALKDYSTICASAPSEFLAELALRHRQALSERNRSLILANLARLDDFFARHAARLDWVRPKAGPIAFPRLSGEAIDAFCHRLVTTHGVLLLPASIFDYPGNHFRIGFGRRSLPAALARLDQFLS